MIQEYYEDKELNIVNLTKQQGFARYRGVLLHDQCQKYAAEQQNHADQRDDPYQPGAFFVIHQITIPIVFLHYTRFLKKRKQIAVDKDFSVV